MVKSIPFTMPSISQHERRAVLDALDSGAIGGNGPIGKKLQERLQSLLNVRHVLLTTSCSHALELAMMVLDIKPGDEVIVPSFTFVTTASSVVRQGAKPIFAEIDEHTMNLDPQSVEDKITSSTRAILPVHYAGLSADMDSLQDIADRYELDLIEDAAQGLGSTYKGKSLGTIGDMGCFSFHVTKNIVGGEGGAFVTNNDAIAERAEIIREKGTNRAKFLRGEVDKYSWVDVGSSFVPSDLIAAMVLAQIERIDEIYAKRRHIWQRYYHELQELENSGSIILPALNPDAEINWHLFSIRVTDLQQRDRVLTELKARGIGATFHFVPLHSSPYARKQWGYRPADLPVTEKVSASLIRLPLYAELTDDEQSYIIEAIYDTLG